MSRTNQEEAGHTGEVPRESEAPVEPNDAVDEVVESSTGSEAASDADTALSVEPDPDAWSDAATEPSVELSIEDLVADLERVTVERDQYLEASRRIQAEFENYRKQVSKRELEARQRANEALIGEMLPILDAFDGAMSNGVDDVVPMRNTLLDALNKQGLDRIDPDDTTFDPNLHEAVMHEDGEGGASGPIVTEVMRAGYVWKGRVIRPAMVRVQG